ncbi:FadR/GntR family transcriptional regulator [Aneurinibacillus aneurinilyticus]|jgi:GntR family transcriptional repressor for pyruvate dehydrogenase complex|uniref:FadR family transcriptional regulator n=2 Tax=Aneurinibacillus aneurinilyticus TaxID=1391 RepID=A0A848CUM9_ANEAE|nr:FadR/GntR family transcriptional regulator [Aneurinibacillus aneurinilyticus]ERI09381.1 FCD domain protein [Aneurinibacillus aneurinilyticus ATCC 12856]MCI1694744.1 FadR family transcriptional regulator [Aneurinibacillus aneurinilyticus]MED0709150.1 FadR/GntR family transcriptional regulator [Aneurinibacillus aneurinilyticus]MED0724827.1 FadR/GntR family transcriptional regulator [Aneurinibacillus aneurinilyticus]MED0734601.1 FadR/GntR family transcriptional regulator [Aneurinibacillus aneu
MSKKEKMSQIISRELLTMIETGQLSPGAKLPTEMELAARFGVSRIPIREALSVLRAAGVISSRQGGGSYVEETAGSALLQRIRIESDDVEGIKHLFEMRKILEPEAAYLAALRRTPEQLERMKQVLKLLENESVDQGKSGMKADIEFHRAIILATQNPIMIQMLESLSSLYERALKITLQPNTELERKRKAVYKEHQNILLAIEAEEPELAKIQCTIHLKNAEKKLSLFLKDYPI